MQNLTARYNYIYNANVLLNAYYNDLIENYPNHYDKTLQVYLDPEPSNGIDLLANAQKTDKQLDDIAIKAQAIINEKNYSSYIDDAYLLLGKANYLKSNYFVASEYFDYTAKTYHENLKTLVEALNWKARCQIQLNNFDKASLILDTMLVYLDKLKKTPAQPLATLAQMRIYQNKTKEAILFLQGAIDKSKNRAERTRWTYILAQLLEKDKQYEDAYKNYSKVEKSNAPFEMYFNAKLNKVKLNALLNNNEETDKIKQLLYLLKDEKNADYKDQIYYQVAEVYLDKNDFNKAEENYMISASKSTKNHYQKGASYLKVADLNFKQFRNYVKAKLYYDSAITVLPKNYPDYDAIVKKANNLEYLSKRYNIIATEDTLQALAKLPEADRLKKIKSMFAPEKAIDATIDNNNFNGNNPFNSTNLNVAEGNNATFYFNNATTISRGISEFKKRWGNRKLEDNWRQSNRSSAQITSQSLANNNPAGMPSVDPDMLPLKSKDLKSEEKNYIDSLPLTAEQLQKSNQKIIDAYYDIGGFYQQVLNDKPEAIKVYQTLLNRFPENNHAAATNYSLYLTYKDSDDKKSNEYKETVLNKYANTVFAKNIIDPNYSAKQSALETEAIKNYDDVFEYYEKKDFKTVINKVDESLIKFPTNSFQSQYDYLKAIAIGRTQNVDKLLAAFNAIKVKYPNDKLIIPLIDDHISYIQAHLNSFKKRAIALIDFDPTEPRFIAQAPKQTPIPVKEKALANNVSDKNENDKEDSKTVTATDSANVSPIKKEEITAKEPVKETNAKPSSIFSNKESTVYYYVIDVADVNTSLSSSRFGIGQFNRGNYTGSNLKHQLKELDANQLIYIGNFSNFAEAKKYADDITPQLSDIMKVRADLYNGFVISKENFDLLIDKERIALYKDFYKNNY